MDIDRSSCLGPTSDIRAEELENEIVLYQPEEGEVRNLNGTGAFIWSLCNGSRTLGFIADQLIEEAPEADPEQIRQDVLAFARELVDEGLLEPVEQPA